jgi:hypothetical protein
LNGAYLEFVEKIEDPSPKVRSAAAYFLMRVIEHQPALIF